MPSLITPLEAQALGEIADHTEIEALVQRAWRARVRRFEDSTDVGSLVNAKSGGCAEDCGFCAQSKYAEAGTPMHAMLDPEQILEHATATEAAGAHRFCMVTHVETAESYYPEVSTTVRYESRLGTIDAVREAGLETCVGGILKLGETREQRVGANPRPDNRSGWLQGETPDIVTDLLRRERETGPLDLRLWDPSTQLRFAAKRTVQPRPDGAPTTGHRRETRGSNIGGVGAA